MEEQILENQNVTLAQRLLQYKKQYIWAVIITSVIVLILFSYWTITAYSDKIYPNTKIIDVNVGRLKKDEALKKLMNYYSKAENSKLLLKTQKSQEALSFGEIKIKYDFNKAVDNAYNLKNEGGVFKKIINAAVSDLNGKTVDLPISYDKQILDEKLEKLENNNPYKAQDDTYEIENDTLNFKYGHSGKGIDKVKAVAQIEAKLKKGIDGEIIFKEAIIKPKTLSADDISIEPKDASVKVINYREIKYIPEVYGAKFDKEMFNQLYKENKGKDGFSMPVETITPKLTLRELKARMFTDTLASHDTFYGNSPQSRKHNVYLAASKVGGIILGPGDEFSYNKIVGPRTAANGFQMAHVYSNGKVIDDFGGGICQVSSTIYNAVLKADIQVTSRKNHMFTVAYAKPGLDATVSYGSIDFKFKNNMPWPIKIVNNSNSTNVRFSIIGTRVEPQKTIEFRSETVQLLPHNVISTPDPNLYEGKTVVDQNGIDGCIVNVYKITKVGDTALNEEFLHKDTYKALEEKVRTGTKPKPKAKSEENINSEPQKPVEEPSQPDVTTGNTDTNAPVEPSEPAVIQEGTEQPVEQ